jgi:hypothetical protein
MPGRAFVGAASRRGRPYSEARRTRRSRSSKQVAASLALRGRLATKRLFVGVPIYTEVDPQFFQCALKLVQEFREGAFGYGATMRTHIGDSAIGRARNALTREFLESDCTHMLMIDSDLVFSPEQIRRILMHGEPIVGGLYAKKQEGPPALVLNAMEGVKDRDSRGLMQVRYIGTGFICVAREVFEAMIDKYGRELSYRSDHDKSITEWDFWQMGVYKYPDGSKRWLSEDWYFCQRAIDLGYKIYADMGVLLKHMGKAAYPLHYQERQLFETAEGERIPIAAAGGSDTA